MTLDSTTSKVQYTQSGTTTAWPVPYKFLDNEDLIVITTVGGVDTTLVLDTDYTVTGAGDDDGGTVTISPAVATGTRVTIYREIDLDQPTELTTAGGWFPKVHEAVFDRLTMIDQQLQEQLDRAVKLAPTTTLNPDTVAEELFEARDEAQAAASAAEDSASAAQEYAGTAAAFMDAAALSAANAGLSESNAAGSEAAAAISAGAAYADATTAESARDTAVLKAAEAAASAAIAGAALNADAWSASVNYAVGDVVYTTTGKTYRCIDPNINNNPDTDDGSDWFLMSLVLGESSNTAYRGDRGKTAYDHSQVAHAPSNAQKNSDITKAEIEAKLTGAITSHSHAAGNADTVDGFHAQKTPAADKIPVAGEGGKIDAAWLPELDTNPVHGSQTFTSNDVFTVPAGVTAIFVTVQGGGAGGQAGADSVVSGTPGGTTSFGSLISATGGGTTNNNGSVSGANIDSRWFTGFYSNGANYVPSGEIRAYGGNASAFGSGGNAGSNTHGGAASGYGAGGGAGCRNTSTYPRGGGAGGYGTRYIVTTPGTSYAVTIGGGGAGGLSNGYYGGAGSAGVVFVWW